MGTVFAGVEMAALLQLCLVMVMLFTVYCSDFDTCGRVNLGQNQFAVGGDEPPNFAPWVVALGIRKDQDKDDYEEFVVQCTGSILTNTFIVSAAHCFDQEFASDNYNVNDLVARVGATKIDSVRHVEVDIVSYVKHPKFEDPKIYYDIALAKLAKAVTFNRRIQAICLPLEPVGNDNLVTVQGWGNGDGELTEINVAARSHDVCSILYKRLRPRIISTLMPDLLPPTMFCTDGNVNSVIGTCHGDSGGPLIKKEIDLTDGSQTYTLVGVVNGNPKGCRAERDFPDYHTSIGNSEVLQWIKDEVRPNTGTVTKSTSTATSSEDLTTVSSASSSEDLTTDTQTAALPSPQDCIPTDLKPCFSAGGQENKCPHVGPPKRNFCLWNARLEKCKHRLTGKECGK